MGRCYSEAKQATLICINDLKLKALKVGRLAAGRHVSKGVDYEATNRIEFFVAKSHAEVLIEVLDRRLGLYEKLSGTYFSDISAFIDVCFVFNFADDFFQHVFYGHKASDSPVLVDHDGHMVAILTEFTE